MKLPWLILDNFKESSKLYISLTLIEASAQVNVLLLIKMNFKSMCFKLKDLCEIYLFKKNLSRSFITFFYIK